jgi:galactonate dehydratase
MKITGHRIDAVHVNHRGDWVFVTVETDEGITGIGEMRAGQNYDAQVAAARKMLAALEGRDPREIEAIYHDLHAGARNKADGFAISGIEPALWDILGKSLNAPVFRLLGGSNASEIRLYANINRATTDRTPERFAANAAEAVAQGFDAVKLAPFDGLPRDVDNAADAAVGIACMEAVRAAIGSEPDLLIDCHSHFTVKGSLEVADALRPLDLYWFEQPTPESNLAACLEVNERCGMTTAGGEQRMFRENWIEVFEHQTMDIIMPDVTVIGGISELKTVADAAAAWGMPTAPHGPFGPITIAAHLHAMAACPSSVILEYGWGEVPWRKDLMRPVEIIENGRIRLTERPGLGFELNPDLLKEHRVALDV